MITNYDVLCCQLIGLLDESDALLPPGDPDRNDQRVAIAISESLGITIEHWKSLTTVEREPYLEKLIERLQEPIALLPTEYVVLQELARVSPQAITAISVAGATDMPRNSVSEILKRLMAIGYIKQPAGARQGWIITPRGICALQPTDRPKH
jgi:DNA-binding MarR family transcriptional regulator